MLQTRVSAPRTHGLLHAYRSRPLRAPPIRPPAATHILPPRDPTATLLPIEQRRGFISRVRRLFSDPMIPSDTESANSSTIDDSESHKVPLADLGAALVGQDPKRRIWFEYPQSFHSLAVRKDWARNIHIRARMPPHLRNADTVTVELLPFWTVQWIFDYVYNAWTNEVETTGRGPRRANSFGGYRISTMGVSICAAEKDHWAHALIFRDDAIENAEELKYRHSSTDINVFIEPGREGFGPLNLLPTEVDPAVAQPFAYGPPLFPNASDQATLLNFQADSTADDNVAYKLRTPITAVAFPTYRLVYRGKYKDGTDIYLDAHGEPSFSIIPTDEHCPLRRRFDTSEDEGLLGRWFMYYLPPELPKEERTGPDDHRLARYAIMPRLHDNFQMFIANEMTRSPISAETWNNPAILPFRREPGSDAVDLEAMSTYLHSLLSGDNPAPLLAPTQTHIPKVVVRPQVSSEPKQKPKSQPEAEEAEESSGPAEGARHGRRLRTGTDHRASRERLLDDRIKSAFANQRLWADQLSGRAKPGTKAKAAAPITVTDRRHYYETLGFKPRVEFISPQFAEKVNEELKAAFYALTRAHHPDRAADPDDEAKRHEMMSRINVAYAHIETLEHRRHYHDPRTYPDPNKKH